MTDFIIDVHDLKKSFGNRRVVDGLTLQVKGGEICGFLGANGSGKTTASYYVLDIAYIIVFLGSLFCREFAGFTGLVSKAIRGRDGFTRDFGCGRYENLSGAISWLTFFAGGAADVRRSRSDWRWNSRTRKNADWFSVEAEERPLFSPCARQPRRQAHQCLGGKLRRFSAIDNGRGDAGRQPGKTQKGIEVGCRDALLASDVMHA